MYEGTPQEETLPANKSATQQQESDYRVQLLAGTSSPEQFLSCIFSADQEGATRSSAENNLSLLNDPEIAARLQDDPEYKDEYQNLRSLSAFHVAQERLVSGNISGATPFLEIASSAANNVAWENYIGWQNYVKATIAYTKGDLTELSRICDEFPVSDSHKEVVEHLKTGLDGGTIDYLRDYKS